MIKLYTYFRSSAAYRVRIALNLKGLSWEAAPVHLVRDGGQQNQPAYRSKSPLGTVPALETESGVLTQSLAIIEYLDERYPAPALLPASAEGRARVRAIALTSACDIHPVNNLRVLNYLGREFGATQEQKDAWYRHWVNDGLLAIEKLLAGDPRTGTFCHGEAPGLADCCLVPQVFNAHRFGVDLAPYPLIAGIEKHCLTLPAFADAAPAAQPDAE